jgi:hypothetical protein
MLLQSRSESSQMVLSRSSLENLFRAMILLAFLIRLLLILYTYGTNDMATWEKFALSGLDHGIHAIFTSFDGKNGGLLMNHPPFAGLLAMAGIGVAGTLPLSFSQVFKIFQLIGDIGTTAVIGKLAQGLRYDRCSILGIMAIYVLSPASILISGYHGNTDSLCILGVALSALAIQRGRYFLAGCALAFAINIKIIPLICIPFFLLTLRQLRFQVHYSLGVLILNIPFILFLSSNSQALINIFGYLSIIEPWGIRAVLLSILPNQLVTEGVVRSIALLALGAVSGATLLQSIFKSQRLLPHQALFISMGVFVFAAPGLGVQYLLYPLAGFVLCKPLKSIYWSILAGVFLVSVYSKFIVSWNPVTSIHTGPFAFHDSVFLGLLTWMSLGVAIFLSVSSPWRGVKVEPMIPTRP